MPRIGGSGRGKRGGIRRGRGRHGNASNASLYNLETRLSKEGGLEDGARAMLEKDYDKRNKGIDEDRSALFEEVKKSETQDLSSLARKSEGLSSKDFVYDKLGNTPLYYAIRSKSDNKQEVIDILIKNDVCINALSCRNVKTPIQMAIEKGDPEIIFALLNNKKLDLFKTSLEGEITTNSRGVITSENDLVCPLVAMAKQYALDKSKLTDGSEPESAGILLAVKKRFVDACKEKWEEQYPPEKAKEMGEALANHLIREVAKVDKVGEVPIPEVKKLSGDALRLGIELAPSGMVRVAAENKEESIVKDSIELLGDKFLKLHKEKPFRADAIECIRNQVWELFKEQILDPIKENRDVDLSNQALIRFFKRYPDILAKRMLNDENYNADLILLEKAMDTKNNLGELLNPKKYGVSTVARFFGAQMPDHILAIKDKVDELKAEDLTIKQESSLRGPK